MSLNDDKRELLKLKQGLIQESETIKEEKPPKIELHGRAKIENILYHYKVPIILCICTAFILTYLTVDYLNREVMDIRVLMVSSTEDAGAVISIKGEQLEKAFERYCPDYDENGSVHVEAYVIDIYRSEHADPNMVMANQTKLFGEMQSGVGQMIMANKDAFAAILGEDEKMEDYFTDLSELFPDDPQVTDSYYYMVKGSNLAFAASWEPSLPDDMYIAVRKNTSGFGSNPEKTEIYRNQALEVLGNIVDNNLLDSTAE